MSGLEISTLVPAIVVAAALIAPFSIAEGASAPAADCPNAALFASRAGGPQ